MPRSYMFTKEQECITVYSLQFLINEYKSRAVCYACSGDLNTIPSQSKHFTNSNTSQ